MKSTSSIIFILFITGLVVLFFFGLFKPASAKISELREFIGAGHRKGLEEEMLTSVLSDMTEEVRSLKEDVGRLKKTVLNKAEKDSFMKDVRALFDQAGFISGAILPAGDRAGDPFDATSLSIKGKSSFESVYCFLQKVEELDYAVKVEKLNLVTDMRRSDIMDVEIVFLAPLNSL